MASPTPSIPDSYSSLFGSPQLGSLGLQAQPEKWDAQCAVCREDFCNPKVLPCLHTFCYACLEKLETNHEQITCPKCGQTCTVPTQGISGLTSDYAAMNVMENHTTNSSPLPCTGCKTESTHAVARCFDCSNYLCGGCVTAHQNMHCFEGHNVINIKDAAVNGGDLSNEKVVPCPQHETESLRLFCRTCNTPICKECTESTHMKGIHDFDYLSKIGGIEFKIFRDLVFEGKEKIKDLKNTVKSVDHFSSALHHQYQKTQHEINAAFKYFYSLVEERRDELLKELEDVYTTKKVSFSSVANQIQEMVECVERHANFFDRITKNSSLPEVLLFKQLLESRMHLVLAYNPDPYVQPTELEFSSNYGAIQAAVKNTFGYIKHNLSGIPAPKPQPIARPVNVISNNDYSYQNGHTNTWNGHNNKLYETNNDSSSGGKFGSPNSLSSLGSFNTVLSDISSIGSYEKWSNGALDIFQNGSAHSDTFSVDAIDSLASKYLSLNVYPVKSQIKRQKMIYHCKFGEFGVLEGQFTEPSGVAVNAQNDIIVADTNNHRIQIFDKEGRFKFQFGECGKRDGQLLYPNRVAVVKTSGDIVVTERSPTHQIQIYNQYGQFVRKFGANILQHPRGVTVDNKGRIIIVECKVMRVLIFDQVGNVLQKFGCSKHLEFPNGVVVNERQEIFISDNRAHCVKVFNYDGVFLRQIGGEGLTNYPIGVCINQAGEILVADNHNNFNITVFGPDDELVNASESKVKHAQCFDVALMDDGAVVLASKDYRLYLYRYAQQPPTVSLLNP